MDLEVRAMFEIDRAKFGAFIAQLRKEKGITQKKLAEMLSISDKAISKWETGNSIPDVALLVPLAEILGVSVTELLECRRMEHAENMDTAQTDVLVKKVIELSEEERNQNKKKNRKIYFLCAVISVIELFVIYELSNIGIIYGAAYLTPILIVGLLSIGFGAYFWLFMKEKLPAYYDENQISVYVDGILHMNMPGVYYNNNNWPYIVKALKGWSIAGMVGFPVAYILLSKLLITFDPLFSSMIIMFTFVFGGLFIPIFVLGRKYQYGDSPRPDTAKNVYDKKRIIGVVLIIFFIVIVSYIFGGGATVSSGNRMMFIASEGRSYWSATYQYFDGYEQRNLWVDEDGFLDVKIITDEGQVDLKITDEEGKVIYEKRDLKTTTFSVPATGRVTIRIDAFAHKGSFTID